VTDSLRKRSAEYERQRAQRREFQEMGQRMRLDNERNIRLILDEFFPAGAPEGLLERICGVQNRLVKEIVGNEKVIRELHDGIGRIANEADLRWTDGFAECARQVREFGTQMGLSRAEIDSLLRNHLAAQQALEDAKNREASRQVEWTRT
jgi:hypothetical protein